MHVALISGASEAVISTQDPHEALERLAARVVPTLVDWVELQVYDERGATVSVLARHSDPAYAVLSRFIEQELPRSMSDQSPSRRIARGEGPFLMPQVTPEMLASFVPHADAAPGPPSSRSGCAEASEPSPYHLWTGHTQRRMLLMEVRFMSKHLQCMRGRHDWQKFETAEGDSGQKCARCGEVIWPDRQPESHGPSDKDWKGYVMPG